MKLFRVSLFLLVYIANGNEICMTTKIIKISQLFRISLILFKRPLWPKLVPQKPWCQRVRIQSHQETIKRIRQIQEDQFHHESNIGRNLPSLNRKSTKLWEEKKPCETVGVKTMKNKATAYYCKQNFLNY